VGSPHRERHTVGDAKEGAHCDADEHFVNGLTLVVAPSIDDVNFLLPVTPEAAFLATWYVTGTFTTEAVVVDGSAFGNARSKPTSHAHFRVPSANTNCASLLFLFSHVGAQKLRHSEGP
jgi:hypothetical protein